MRRLPLYLLLDVSGSMRGEPIASVNEGIRLLADTLRQDPYALETTFISLITFNNTVEQLVPLTELYKFIAPELTAQYGTYLGKALRFLSNVAEKEIVKATYETKGDWKPLAFIMSDGRSGDKISKALTDFNRKLFGNILVCATGDDPNIDDLKLISNNVLRMHNMNKETIHGFFKWVSASVSATSLKIEEMNTTNLTMEELPPLPSSLYFL